MEQDLSVLIPFKSGLWLERDPEVDSEADLAVLIPFKSGLWLELESIMLN